MRQESIHIEKLTTIEQFHQCEELQRQVWGLSDTDVIPLHLLLIAQKSGGLVLGAFDEEGRMIGLLFGFLGARDATAQQLKHCSHMVGVLEEWRGRGVGYQLKLAQREHALAQGLELVTWTYDPLESLNAALNIGKLGVVCRTYFRELYGEMEDERNVGLSSDRFEAEWWVASQRVVARVTSGGYRPSLDAVLESGAQLLNPATAGPDGLVLPSPPSLEPMAEETVLVEIPAHLQAIKAADMALAQQWRAQTRQIFERCFAAGYTVTEFVSELQGDLRRSYYVLQRNFEVI
jgi:predicted GNAT superfamily acetyltransferase